MNWDLITASPLIASLGWTLIHSLWQIALMAAALSFLLRVFRRSDPNLRYIMALTCLFVCLLLPAITFVQIINTPNEAAGTDVAERLNRSQIDEDLAAAKDNAKVIDSRRQAANLPDRTTPAFVATVRTFVGDKLKNSLSIVVGLWLLGIAFMSMRLGGGLSHLHRYKTSGIQPADDAWQERFASLCQKLGIAQTVRLLRSTLVETPIAVGTFKPLIIVPASVFLQMNPVELETIIAHELVHIRRYDPLVNSIQSVIEVLFFYHPCIWWISREVRREREFAADAAVTRGIDTSDLVYASALATFEEIRLFTNKQTPQIAVAANGGNLMERIQRILNKNTEIRKAKFAWSAGLALVLISALLTVVFSAGSPVFVNAEGKSNDRKLAIGFVSIPPVDRTANPPKDADATARLIISKLTQHRVPAIGFIQGSMISDGTKLYPVRAEIIRLWRDAGLDVGIGNFNHIWFSKTPYDDYVAGVEKNEAVAKRILGEKNLSLRYFSYPYLNTGKSVDERDRFENWLGDRGLRSVKYTIDNNEWMYSFVYDMARNDNDIATMTEIRVEFVKYMNRMFDHYEAYSKEMFGRDIPQTMVLTPSRLVADSADDLFGMIEKRGYTFVSMDEALSDNAYKTEENFIGDSGISWFERWRMKPGKTLLDEPKVDGNVQKMWSNKRPKG